METIKKPIISIIVSIFCIPLAFSQWTTINTGASGSMYAIYFFDPMNGMITALTSTVRTTNGGTSWSPVAVFDLQDVDFASSTVGYAAGVSGSSLQKTTNGGVSWTSLTAPDVNSLWGVSVVDASNVFVCGTAGVVWKTVNGGTSFSTCNLPITFSIATDLWFFSSTTGCVVTDGGQIYRTTDAGANWNLAFDGSGAFAFKAIYFPDASNGYAVGSLGKIYKSTDAGVSWTLQTSGTSTNLEGVHFYDVNTGMACGDGGLVLRTTNAGTTWISQTSITTGTTSRLYACWMTSANTAFASGESNTVIKTANLSAIEDEWDGEGMINIFPNPGVGIINITSEKEISSIRIFDPLGKLVYTTVSPVYKLMIEIPEKMAGTYLVEIEIAGKKYMKKFINN